MVTNASMIQFMLRKQGVETCLLGNAECTIERIAVLESHARKPGVLYVSDSQPSHRKPRANSAYAILYRIEAPAEKLCEHSERNVVDSSSNFTVGEEEPSSTKSPLDSAARSNEKTAHFLKAHSASLLELAYAALRELDQWDLSLMEALLQRAPLTEFIRLGRDILTSPIAYFDRNLIVLASSADYWLFSRKPDEAYPSSSINGQMPPSRAVDLVEDPDYLKAAEKREPFYYESVNHRFFYGVNTFDGDDYLARLVVALPEGQTQLQRGEEHIIAHFHHRLEEFHRHYAGNVDVVSSQNDSLHSLVRASLLGSVQPTSAETSSVFESYGWRVEDDFSVAKIVFFEGVHWEDISLYLCGLLERTTPGSCAFPSDRQIVWLVNLTRIAHEGTLKKSQSGRLVETLVPIMRDYACKAGISNVFSPFDNAHAHFLEAVEALEVGQVSDPHLWYYHFSNYAFEYLLAKGTEELSGAQLCHPALSTLRDYDSAHDSDFARTLVCFLRSNQNTTHAADELFIHRTSLMRRMAQIQSIVSVDLDNPDEVLYLLLSAKLLGM